MLVPPPGNGTGGKGACMVIFSDIFLDISLTRRRVNVESSSIVKLLQDIQPTVSPEVVTCLPELQRCL